MKRYSSLTLILLLVGALAMTQLAPAAAIANPAPVAEEFELEEGEEDEEFETEACEAEEEEFEFDLGEAEEEEFEVEDEECGEEESAKKNRASGSGPVSAPSACLVRQAESKITTLPASDKVELTVHYKTWTPGSVAVALKLKDHKGTLGIEHAVKHFGLGGTLHLTTKLADGVMDRAAAAKEFDISLKAGKSPSFCDALLEQRLRSAHPVGNVAASHSTAKGTVAGSIVWTTSDSR
jgi:hypothetical protein